MTRPAAILFDFGGTLDADGIAWKERFRRLWTQEIGPIEPKRFDRAFYDSDDALVGNVAADLPLDATVERLVSNLCERLEESPSGARQVAVRFCLEASHGLAQSARLLESLSGRYRLGVVSNFYGNLEAVCRESGLAPYLAATIDSTVVGATKPDPRIFEAALARLGLAGSQTWFVGDSPARDMAGARALGMGHVLLLAESEPRQDAAGCCPGDPVIRRLADLPGVLG